MISSHTDQLRGGNGIEYGGIFKLGPMYMAFKDMELSKLGVKLGVTPPLVCTFISSFEIFTNLGKRILGWLLSNRGFRVVSCNWYYM